MNKVLSETISLCPICLNRVEAKNISNTGNVYLVKACREHGEFKTLIWRGGAEDYADWGAFGIDPVPPLQNLCDMVKGCPYDCGLCPSHKANTCSMIMLVTERCNMGCPVCLAGSTLSRQDDPGLRTIEEMYQVILETTGAPTIQLSGGEPTLRDDLPQIVALGRRMGFPHIVINSNGVRIAKDMAYLQDLVQAGAGTIYLQFDGLSNAVYRYTRGQDLLSVKIKALENCSEARIGVVLVPTLIPKQNGDQLGAIISLAKGWMPTVRGVHIQPMSYFGRYPSIPGDEDRITIPDVIRGLVSQTHGELHVDDFFPRRSASSYCTFSGLFVLRNGRLQSLTQRPRGKPLPASSCCRKPPWESARSFLELHWQLPTGDTRSSGSPSTPLERLCSEVAMQGLVISCMPFQDVWNIDLHRLERCCLHVTTMDKRIVPFCAYYLTGLHGERLHASAACTVT